MIYFGIKILNLFVCVYLTVILALLTTEAIEVINFLEKSRVYETIKNYTVRLVLHTRCALVLVLVVSPLTQHMTLGEL